MSVLAVSWVGPLRIVYIFLSSELQDEEEEEEEEEAGGGGGTVFAINSDRLPLKATSPQHIKAGYSHPLPEKKKTRST